MKTPAPGKAPAASPERPPAAPAAARTSALDPATLELLKARGYKPVVIREASGEDSWQTLNTLGMPLVGGMVLTGFADDTPVLGETGPGAGGFLPLRGVGGLDQVMMALARLEQQVLNQSAQIASLRLDLSRAVAAEVKAAVAGALASAGRSVPVAETEPYDDAVGATAAPALRTRPVEAMLASSVERGAALVDRLDADPHMLDSDAFAALIGVSVQGLHDKRKRGEVLGLMQSKRKSWFPDWQLDASRRPLAGLKDLHAVFDGDPWRVYRFLTQAQPGLEGATGLTALAAGHVEQALTVARGLCLSGYS